ncbi:hypothetical protein N2152v2_005980 [Parachlorella kessleri]
MPACGKQGTSVQQAIDKLNESRAAESGSRPVLTQRRLNALREAKQAAARGFLPSGKRQPGVGCSDEEQGILHAQSVESGGAKLHITLLAAGFVIGPSGVSVREISRASGADIRSWNDTFTQHGTAHQVRCVVVEGRRRAVVMALEIITEAVDRYKDLCEGKFCGHVVDRVQQVHGVSFYYSPPPRAAVPYAAALKSFADRSTGPVKVLDFQPDLEKENVPAPATQMGFLVPISVIDFEAATPAAVNAHLLPLPAPAPADQTYQLLAALASGSSAMTQAPCCELTPHSLGLCSHTPLTPGLPAYSTGLGCRLEQVAAGNLDELLLPRALERMQHFEALPSYSLFGQGSLFSTDQAMPAPAQPATLELLHTPAPGPTLQVNPDNLLLATGFPSFQSFAQQSPYYSTGAANPWLLETSRKATGSM